MKTVTLQAFTDESTGTLGLGVKGMPRTNDTNSAVDGMTIAHDLLEHVNGVREIGSIDDELEALGALWFTRGQFGELRRDGYGSRYTVHENIAGDVVRMFRDHVEGGAYVAAGVPTTRQCTADIDLAEILDCAARGWDSEFNEPHLGRDAWPTYRDTCMARMRIGYRKAQRKYKDASRANSLFWAIANAVDRYARHVGFDGAEFRVRFGFSSEGYARASCEEHYA